MSGIDIKNAFVYAKGIARSVVRRKQVNVLNLYFVRHGFSEGNENREVYKDKADHAVELHPKGVLQAGNAGKFLAHLLYEQYLADPYNFGKIRVWNSPYYRTRGTAWPIIYELGQKFGTDGKYVSYRENVFLIEQKAGLYDGQTSEEYKELHPEEAMDYQKHIIAGGKLYAKTPLGDSAHETLGNVRDFFGTVSRDFEGANFGHKKHQIKHAIIVAHGVTINAAIMGWKNYSPEWFAAERNPGNCWIRHIRGSSQIGYVDNGYIHGDGAPLYDPRATMGEIKVPGAFMFKPERSDILVPSGIKIINPYSCPYDR